MSVIKENWDMELNLNDIAMRQTVNIKLINQHVLSLFDKYFSIWMSNVEGNVQSGDDELKSLTELNKQLLLDIESKEEELTRKKAQYKVFKRDQKILSQGIKEKYDTFLMFKKKYMKVFKMYYTIESKSTESCTIYLQFFTDIRNDSNMYSVKLLKDPKTRRYELLSTDPQIKNFEEIQEQLRETNNVAATLCYIRQAFKEKNLRNDKLT